jgi:hypothetical protein
VSLRRLLPAAALVLGLGLVATLVVAALHRPAQGSLRLTGRPVAVRRSLTPTQLQFGDPVVVTIEVVVDKRRVDPGSVVVSALFSPFSVRSSARTVHAMGDVSVVRVVDRLDCLDPACLPAGAASTFRFPKLRVSYAGGETVEAWPSVRVAPRVRAADLEHPLLRVAPPTEQPTYRLPPTATGWTLLAAALVVALAGLALLARAVVPALRAPRRRTTTLERLLRELTTESNGDGRRRRSALEQLARELEPLHEPLSYESRVLAWAPHEPSPHAVSELVQRIREATVA